MIAPMGTNADNVATLNQTFNDGLEDLGVKEHPAILGFEPMSMSPPDLGKLNSSEIEMRGKVICFLKIEPD